MEIPGDVPARWDRDTALTVLYTAHHRSLVRIAGLLLDDVGAAEEVVQDAYVGMYRRWYRLRDPDKAVAYLRQSTVNGARSALRRRGRARRALPRLLPTGGAPDVATQVASRRAVTEALARLPERQREVLVLRYYADWSEAQIADALGISRGAVKTHASRGLAALRPSLETVR